MSCQTFILFFVRDVCEFLPPGIHTLPILVVLYDTPQGFLLRNCLCPQGV